LVGEEFFLLEKELCEVLGSVHVSALLVIDFLACLASLEIIVKFVGFFAVATNFCVELLACASQAQLEVFCDFSSVVVSFVDEFFVYFLFLLLQWRASTFINVTCAAFQSTLTADVMSVTFRRTAVMFHTYLTVKNDVAVPVMIKTEIFLDWTFISLDYFMNFEQILNRGRFLLNFEL